MLASPFWGKFGHAAPVIMTFLYFQTFHQVRIHDWWHQASAPWPIQAQSQHQHHVVNLSVSFSHSISSDAHRLLAGTATVYQVWADMCTASHCMPGGREWGSLAEKRIQTPWGAGTCRSRKRMPWSGCNMPCPLQSYLQWQTLTASSQCYMPWCCKGEHCEYEQAKQSELWTQKGPRSSVWLFQIRDNTQSDLGNRCSLTVLRMENNNDNLPITCKDCHRYTSILTPITATRIKTCHVFFWSAILQNPMKMQDEKKILPKKKKNCLQAVTSNSNPELQGMTHLFVIYNSCLSLIAACSIPWFLL